MSRFKSLPTIDGKGIVDLHVHAGPEFLRRRYDPHSLADEAHRTGVGVVIKNHFTSTTSWSVLASKSDADTPVIGSVTLNRFLGGIDDHGIRAAISGLHVNSMASDSLSERFVVWMPTIHAEAHLAKFGRYDIPSGWGVAEHHRCAIPEGSGLRIQGEDGRLTPGAIRAIQSIVTHDLVLATGHLARDECKLFVASAYEAGARRLIVTHPLWDVTEFPVEELVTLWTQYGAYAELCYVNLDICGIDHCRLNDYVSVIRSVGPEGVILTTDLGQDSQPPFSEGFRQFLELLSAEGVPEDDLLQMSIVNPRRLLFSPRSEFT